MTVAFRNSLNVTNSFWAILKGGEKVKMAMVVAQEQYEHDVINGAKLVLIGDLDKTLLNNRHKHAGAA